MVKNHDFSDVVAEYGATRFFQEKRAVSPFIIYHGLTLCQKSKKSYVQLAGKSDYGTKNYSRYSSTDNVDLVHQAQLQYFQNFGTLSDMKNLSYFDNLKLETMSDMENLSTGTSRNFINVLTENWAILRWKKIWPEKFLSL